MRQNLQRAIQPLGGIIGIAGHQQAQRAVAHFNAQGRRWDTLAEVLGQFFDQFPLIGGNLERHQFHLVEFDFVIFAQKLLNEIGLPRAVGIDQMQHLVGKAVVVIAQQRAIDQFQRLRAGAKLPRQQMVARAHQLLISEDRARACEQRLLLTPPSPASPCDVLQTVA